MQDIAYPPHSLKHIAQTRYEMDANLPKWARRTHPIVRRHLGMYWRTITPQLEPIAQWYIGMSVLVLLTYPIPFLYTLILPMVIVAVGIMPPALYYYGQTLYNLAADSSRSMVNEVENATLLLLLTTPFPPSEIILAKLAGSVWRQTEALSFLLMMTAMSQVPTFVLLYLNRFPSEIYGFTSQLMTVAVFGVSILRLPIEMAMTAAIGHYVGAITHGRSAAVGTTIALVIFYFVLINLPRFAPLSTLMQLMVDAVLPLVVPLAIIWVLLRLTERHITENL